MFSLTFVAAALAWSQPTLHRASPRAVLVQAQPVQHPLHVPPRARIVRAGGGPVEKLESVGEPKPIADALAGLTVGFSLLSKPIASSAIAGVDPLVGLWSSVVMGVTAPLLGSRPGVISGAAAVVVVPLGAMVATHGTKYIPLTIFLCAIFEGIFGVFRLAKLTLYLGVSALRLPQRTRRPALYVAAQGVHVCARLCAGRRLCRHLRHNHGAASSFQVDARVAQGSRLCRPRLWGLPSPRGLAF